MNPINESQHTLVNSNRLWVSSYVLGHGGHQYK